MAEQLGGEMTAAGEPTLALPAPTERPLAAEEAPLASEPETSPSDAPPAPPIRPSSRRPDINTMLAARSPIIRLGGLPNMFGDSFGTQIQVGDFAGVGVVDIPPPGGTRRVKISENDKALPMDRVFFNYNHFQNALESSVNGLGVRSFPLDQYTLGVEKTFFDKVWSVELRLPFSRTPQIAGDSLAMDSGDVGNLAITMKRMVYASQTTAVGIGLPIEVPTGSDVSGEGASSTFSLSNDAVHLAPFIGMLSAPTDRVFYQGFLQVDLATHGNRVTFGGSDLGRLDEQNLLYVDLAVGYWLYQNPFSPCITGLATMVEYHYTTTLQNADMVSGSDQTQFLQFGNTFNRLDVSNLTVGLHTELGKTTVRVGGAFPLVGGANRLYDAELQVSVNREF